MFKDSIIVITGGSSGLGKALAQRLVERGAYLALIARDKNKLVRVKDELSAICIASQRIEIFPCDVTDYDAYAAAVNSVVKEWGRLDILVNNAAIIFYGTILEDTLENWRLQIKTNLEAYYMGCKLVAPQMVRQNEGRIISISSVESYATAGTNGAYDAAKGGINALTKSMAVELAPYNIQVNAVAAGFVATEMVEKLDPSQMSELAGMHPIKLVAQPEEIAELVLFFASPASDYITGQVLPGVYD